MRGVSKWALTALGSALAWLCWALGGWDAALQMMFLVMGLDLLGGLLVAFHGRSPKTPLGGFHSAAFFQGLTRKLMMLALVMLATALDRALDAGNVSRLCAVGFYTANEGLSIVEKAAQLGLPFPESLLRVLETMRKKEADREK